MLLLAAHLAQAAYVAEIHDEVSTDLAGTWFRAFPVAEGGWELFIGGGGGQVYPMTDDWQVDRQKGKNLTGRGDLQDHGIQRCPDGGYLHIASSTKSSFNDSAYAWRYDADWSEKGSATIEESSTERMHNDMAVVCGPGWQGVAFKREGPSQNPRSTFFRIGQDGAVSEQIDWEGGPQMTGSALGVLDEDLLAVGFEGYMQGKLKLTRYDASFASQGEHSVDLPPQGEAHYWSQGFLKVGDIYLVANMSRADSDGFAADEGNVWLHILDADFKVLESHQITNYSGPEGVMRPGLARKGDTLLVTYDHKIRGRFTPVTLDLTGLAVEDSDPGPGDSSDPNQESGDDSDSGGISDDGGGCGRCDAGLGAGSWLLGLVVLARRRRSA